MHLLDQEAPGLATQLQNLTLNERRSILASVATSASKQIVDLELNIQQLIEHALKYNSLSDDQVAELRSYVDFADDKYFSAQESGEPETVWGNWFAKARLGAAIVSAFSGTTLHDTIRAAYELCFISEDKKANATLIQNEINLIKAT